MNEGYGAGPQLVSQLAEDDPIGESLCQVLRQGLLQPGLEDLQAETGEQAGSAGTHSTLSPLRDRSRARKRSCRGVGPKEGREEEVPCWARPLLTWRSRDISSFSSRA